MAFDLDYSIDNRISASSKQIEQFCQRWKIAELALVGSVLRDDFRTDSDIDILLTFCTGAGSSLFDLMDIKDELKKMLGREIDIANKEMLKNPYRRYEILKLVGLVTPMNMRDAGSLWDMIEAIKRV